VEVRPSSDYPFQGGILGYLGYPELIARSVLAIQDAFVGIHDWAVIVDHGLARTTLLLPPAYAQGNASRIRALLQTPAAMDALDVLEAPAFSMQSGFQRQLHRSAYDEAFSAITAFIAAGACYQVNLTQRVTAQVAGIPLAAYLQLRASTPAPFSAFIGWPDGGLLSVSPERFVQLRGRHVLTQPIKGTRPRHNDPVRDQELARELQQSEKDQAENLMVVDLLRNDLGRVC